MKSRYSTEKTCTAPSKVECDLEGESPVFDCPKELPSASPRDAISSCVGQFFTEVPLDQCSGLVVQSYSRDEQNKRVPSYQIGCYARRR